MGTDIDFSCGVRVLEKGCGVLHKYDFASGSCGGGVVDEKTCGISLPRKCYGEGADVQSVGVGDATCGDGDCVRVGISTFVFETTRGGDCGAKCFA